VLGRSAKGGGDVGGKKQKKIIKKRIRTCPHSQIDGIEGQPHHLQHGCTSFNLINISLFR
jgi:hypothetical protein